MRAVQNAQRNLDSPENGQAEPKYGQAVIHRTKSGKCDKSYLYTGLCTLSTGFLDSMKREEDKKRKRLFCEDGIKNERNREIIKNGIDRHNVKNKLKIC